MLLFAFGRVMSGSVSVLYLIRPVRISAFTNIDNVAAVVLDRKYRDTTVTYKPKIASHNSRVLHRN